MVLSESGAVPTDRRTAERRSMNIGNVGTTTYNAWTRRVNEARNKSSGNFENAIYNQGLTTNLVLHGASDEMKEQGYEAVGSWADARTGVSTSVYKAKDFDENNPVYLMKIWDADGNVTEKEVNMNEVNPESSDVYDMYAYSCHLSNSGKYPEAQTMFMQSLPVESCLEQFGLKEFDDIYTKPVNWMTIIKGWMDMQYGAGNMKGYMDFKGFYDFLARDEETVKTDINFSRFAPNAPEEVRKAFVEAAKETGYSEGERMDYISQVLVHQVENRQNGVANYTDVFGSSLATALQSAREILYDLENPLMPVSQRGENAAKYIKQEKEFYRTFIEKLERYVSD